MRLQMTWVFLLAGVWSLSGYAGELSDLARGVKCDIPKRSSWNWTDDKLISESKLVLVANLIRVEKTKQPPSVVPDFDVKPSASVGGSGFLKWTFKVSEVLKGDFEKDSEFVIVGVERGDRRDPLPYMCEKTYNFSLKKRYLIVANSYHPKAYAKVSSPKDGWLMKVRALIRK